MLPARTDLLAIYRELADPMPRGSSFNMPGPDLRAPIHQRAKSENNETIRRDAPGSHEKVRFQSGSLIQLEEAKGSGESNEMKKSRSLTKKIRELNHRDGSRSDGVATTREERIPKLKNSSPPDHKASGDHSKDAAAPSSSGASRMKSTQLQAHKPPVHIPSLTLDKMAVPVTSTGMVHSSSSTMDKKDSDQVVYQHFSFPKSVSVGGTPVAGPKLLALKAATNPPVQGTEFIYVETVDLAAADKDDQAAENDRVLQERLQEAKALNRKDTAGATMHTFSLWKKGGAAISPTTLSMTSSASRLLPSMESVNQTDIADDSRLAPGKSGKLRGPLAALADCHRAASPDLGGYSDDEFVEVDEEDMKVLDTSALSHSTPPQNRSVARNLAAALRCRVVDAQALQSPTASPVRVKPMVCQDDEVRDELETSYSSFVMHTAHGLDAHSNSVSMLEDISGVIDDELSDVSVEEDSQMNWDLTAGMGAGDEGASIHTMMSRSGPAAFGSMGQSLLTSQAPTAMDTLAVEEQLERTRRASTGGDDDAVAQGVAYGTQQFKSLTSRDHTNTAANLSGASTPPSGKKVSKYQVLRSLRSTSKRLDQEMHTSGSLPNATFPTGNTKASSTPIKTPSKQLSETQHINSGEHVLHRPNSLQSLERSDSKASSDVNESVSVEESPLSPLKWKKGEAIGEGTFGKVFKGLNEKTGELLAIKQLCLADGTDKEVDELQKEINVMWELDHENIVRYCALSLPMMHLTSAQIPRYQQDGALFIHYPRVCNGRLGGQHVVAVRTLHREPAAALLLPNPLWRCLSPLQGHNSQRYQGSQHSRVGYGCSQAG